MVANHSFDMTMIGTEARTLTAAVKWGQTATALTPELLQEARQTGELYMQAWMGSDREQMRRLTAPFGALPNGNLERFRHALEHRADDGVCPLDSEEKIALQPVTDLTLWEQDWLKQLAGTNMPMNMEAFADANVLNAVFINDGESINITNRGENISIVQSAIPATANSKPAPEKLAPGNDTAVFRYTAQGRNFLMVLARHNQHWQMLEAAMPL